MINDSNTAYDCTPKLTVAGQTYNIGPVTYTGDKTPTLSAITPRYGSERGGESVTFTGAGFTGTATVLIDDRACSVTSQSDTEITCTTMDKPFSSIKPEHPSLVINIDGQGDVATKGLLYRYVARWSDELTWAGDYLPDEGDAVEIPAGRALLVDVDVVPQLSFVSVLGSLIFAPDANKNHHRYFDAGYIIINGGYMEVGTEEFPYDSYLTITMHGDEFTPALPIYGNKVIAVRNGLLDMHGPARSHTWSELETTAPAGSTSITLVNVGGTNMDWQVGEEIVIASTDFVGRHAEKRTIASISNVDSNPVITFDTPLTYKHYAGVETYGTDTLEMRAEVGLLSRKVVYRGDPETSPKN